MSTETASEHVHEWERGDHMAAAFGVDGRRLACAICGELKPASGRRMTAVMHAPRLSDLRDAICFVERHDHLATASYCPAGRSMAYRIREALIARYMYRADPIDD